MSHHKCHIPRPRLHTPLSTFRGRQTTALLPVPWLWKGHILRHRQRGTLRHRRTTALFRRLWKGRIPWYHRSTDRDRRTTLRVTPIHPSHHQRLQNGRIGGTGYKMTSRRVTMKNPRLLVNIVKIFLWECKVYRLLLL